MENISIIRAIKKAAVDKVFRDKILSNPKSILNEIKDLKDIKDVQITEGRESAFKIADNILHISLQKKMNLSSVSGGIGNDGSFATLRGVSFDNATGQYHLDLSKIGIVDKSGKDTWTVVAQPDGSYIINVDDGRA